MNTRAYPVTGLRRRLPLGLGALALMAAFALPVSGHAAGAVAASAAADELALLRASTLELLNDANQFAAAPAPGLAPGDLDDVATAWAPDLAAAGRRALESAVVLPAAGQDELLAEESPTMLSRTPAESAPTGASL